MKNLTALLVLVVCSAFSGIPALASQSSVGKVLSCELVDKFSGRILDREEAPVDPAAPGYRDPILFLFGRGSVDGTVRDVAGSEPGERDLELVLSYQVGMANGRSQAGGSYLRTQAASEEPLAETTIAEPDFGIEIGLRCFLRSGDRTLLEDAVRPMTTITYENGNGSASGFCDSNMSWFCYDDLKRRAHEAAARDAQWRCELRQGKADTFMPSCNDFCSPFSLPPNSGNQYVSCNSNCSIRCEIP